MRNIPKPVTAVSDILDDCVRSVQDKNLKIRLTNAKPEIELAEINYDSLGVVSQLHLVKRSELVAEVDVSEMEKIYKQTFVKSKRTKPIYSSLKKACRNDICPLCGQRTVHQLDHYLPISQHPALAITPINLVPACAECNKEKLNYGPEREEDQTLHPYFDDLTNIRWLYAEVQKTEPVSLIFLAKPATDLNATLRKRILGHFSIFKLGALYASHAAEELQNIKFGLRMVAMGEKSEEKLKEHLTREAMSRFAMHKNSWQTAMYEAVAASKWFCTEGYLSS